MGKWACFVQTQQCSPLICKCYKGSHDVCLYIHINIPWPLDEGLVQQTINMCFFSCLVWIFYCQSLHEIWGRKKLKIVINNYGGGSGWKCICNSCNFDVLSYSDKCQQKIIGLSSLWWIPVLLSDLYAGCWELLALHCSPTFFVGGLARESNHWLNFFLVFLSCFPSRLLHDGEQLWEGIWAKGSFAFTNPEGKRYPLHRLSLLSLQPRPLQPWIVECLCEGEWWTSGQPYLECLWHCYRRLGEGRTCYQHILATLLSGVLFSYEKAVEFYCNELDPEWVKKEALLCFC